MNKYSQHSAANKHLVFCHVCEQLSSDIIQYCPRCHSRLHVRKPHSLQKTWALMIAAVLLYIPANIFPVMTTISFQQSSANTILDGVIYFWKTEAYLVAVTIFVASVLIPGTKLIILSWLCISSQRHDNAFPQRRTQMYTIINWIGRWSMIDVFVVAILVALVQIDNIISIQPGPGIIAFAGVVILTMWATNGFDERLIWDKMYRSTR